jgi:hypothetical protein
VRKLAEQIAACRRRIEIASDLIGSARALGQTTFEGEAALALEKNLLTQLEAMISTSDTTSAATTLPDTPWTWPGRGHSIGVQKAPEVKEMMPLFSTDVLPPKRSGRQRNERKTPPEWGWRRSTQKRFFGYGLVAGAGVVVGASVGARNAGPGMVCDEGALATFVLSPTSLGAIKSHPTKSNIPIPRMNGATLHAPSSR